LPGSTSASPTAAKFITGRSTAAESGPRSTRSPRKTTRRPPNVALDRAAQADEQRSPLVDAAVHVADDIERARILALVDGEGMGGVQAGP
jgi:hypothetical protein